VTLVLAYWLAISTTMYAIAHLSHLPAAIHATQWATLPTIRRLVDGTAALSIVAATVAGPSVPVLADEGSQPVVIEIGDDGLPLPPQGEDQEPLPPHLQPEGVARIGWTPTPAELPPIAAPDDAGNARGDATEATTWPVEAGDNLWTIAARHLAAATGSGAPEPDLADYWQRVVVANERVIRSGDPDLIYPGETIVLPPVTEVLP
jgi:hypothetical protein